MPLCVLLELNFSQFLLAAKTIKVLDRYKSAFKVFIQFLQIMVVIICLENAVLFDT